LARATASHTGALLAASDVTVEALFRQAGVIRTDTLDEMLDVAELLVHQPMPRGRRVAILTNAGGPAVMFADTCEARGLAVPPLSDTTQARLRELLPAEAAVANPVDMLAAATADQYAQSICAIAEDPNVDAVISIFLPPLATQPVEVARAIATAVDGLCDWKPVLGVFMSAQAFPELDTPDGGRVPGYHTPEPAAIALGHAVRYLVEVLKDVAVRLSPLTRGDAASMLRELRSFPLLEGYRGSRRCDVDALEDVLLRISALAEDHPQIAEVDCNPVIVGASGADVVDARVRVAPAAPRRPFGARR
jgi:acyl-CoA synthetase (NDP forming)